MKFYLLLFFNLLFASAILQAQDCPDDEVEFSLQIEQDNYPAETSWDLKYSNGEVIFEGSIWTYNTCIPEGSCVIFTIYDEYGDGICCGFGDGSYTVSLDGSEVATGGDFGDEESVELNCPVGSTCTSGEIVSVGSQSTMGDDLWYSFSPEETGSYLISSCSIDPSCNSAIWIYDDCNGLQWDQTQNGTSWYSDECSDGQGATISANMQGGETYHIRIGDLENACAGSTINWEITYEGEITGCTDPAACNFEPLATIEDASSCLYLPDPECLAFAPTFIVGNTTLTQRDVAIDIQIPWEVIYGPDDHLWVTERRGQVLRINPETGNTEVILNLQSEVSSGGEPGMLGMVLHPDFETNNYLYLAYTYVPTGGFSNKNKVVRFEYDGSGLTNETVIIEDIPGGGIHNGTRLLITPDEKLLITTGDAGNQGLPQNINSVAGKVLRLNLDGSIPSDNPVPGNPVYSFGHRNPQGLCFGPNGIIYSSEHGASISDEFNIIEEYRNYGWPTVEGPCDDGSETAYCETNNVREPLADWSPCVAVNDIVYYDHPAIPEFQNSVLMAVLGGLGGGAERITQLQLNEDGTEVIQETDYFTEFGRLRDVAINPHTGSIYIATNGPSYPGAGPNRIIEVRNYEYEITGIENTSATTELNQFVNIFPNPVSDQCQIQFSENFIGKQFELFSMNGQKVLEKTVSSPTEMIFVGHLPKGHYYIKAQNSQGTITKSIMVQ